MKNIELIEKLSQLRQQSCYLAPDAFNRVALALYGYKERKAQELLRLYQYAIKYGFPFWIKEEDARQQFEEAEAIASKCLDLRKGAFDYAKTPEYISTRQDDEGNVCFFFKTKKEKIIQRLECALRSAETYSIVHEMIKKGTEIRSIVRQCTYISDSSALSCCLDERFADEKNRPSVFRIYEGDIIVSYNENPDPRRNLWDRWEENGVYVARWDGFRQLLYTHGRGYITGHEPNYACKDCNDKYNEDYLAYDKKHAYNYRRFTWGHSWDRIGNIFADISILKEPKKTTKDE